MYCTMMVSFNPMCDMPDWQREINLTKQWLHNRYRFSSPGRKHAVVLSVQLVSNDLVVCTHSSLKGHRHEVLRDFPFQRPEVIL